MFFFLAMSIAAEAASVSNIRVRSDNSPLTEGRIFPPPGPLAFKFDKPANTLWKGTLTRGNQVIVSREDGNGYSTAEFSFGNLATGDYAINIRIVGNATKTVHFSVRTVVQPTQPPRISPQPVGTSVVVGSDFRLSIGVDDPNATFQWYKDGVPLAFEEDSVLDIYASDFSDAGSYVCVASNRGGSTASNGAVVSVQPPPPPVITSQPVGGSVMVGGELELIIGADDPDATFQWYKDGVLLDGEEYATLEISDAQLSEAGSYVCVASNEGGSTDSNAAIVVVQLPPPPVITSQPVGKSATVGDSFELSIEVNDEGATFQWYKNGVELPDETESALNFDGVELGDSGAYRCAATNAGGSVESSVAQVTVRRPAPPVITQQPSSAKGRRNGTAQFSVVAEGTGELTYQWLKDGSELDETEDTFTIDELTVSDAGKYHVVVTNAGGSVKSRIVTLTVESGVSPGQYAGIFSAPSDVKHETSGSIKVTVTKEGRFTGSAQIGGVKYGFSSKFDEDDSAAFETKAPKSGAEPLEVTLMVDEEDRIVGTVSASGWDADVLLERNAFISDSTCPSAGTYTVLLAPDDNNAQAPSAYGFLTMKIAGNGIVTSTGKLADGSAVTTSSSIGGQGDIPLYVPLYAAKGAALGWLNTSNEAVTGAVIWIKPKTAVGPYPTGFITTIESLGAPYQKEESNLPDGTVMIISGADLGDSITVPMTIGQNGRIIAGRSGVRILVNANGSFSGSFTSPVTRRPVSFSGAFYQPTQGGFGFFKSAGMIGEVYVGAPLDE